MAILDNLLTYWSSNRLNHLKDTDRVVIGGGATGGLAVGAQTLTAGSDLTVTGHADFTTGITSGSTAAGFTISAATIEHSGGTVSTGANSVSTAGTYISTLAYNQGTNTALDVAADAEIGGCLAVGGASTAADWQFLVNFAKIGGVGGSGAGHLFVDTDMRVSGNLQVTGDIVSGGEDHIVVYDPWTEKGIGLTSAVGGTISGGWFLQMKVGQTAAKNEYTFNAADVFVAAVTSGSTANAYFTANGTIPSEFAAGKMISITMGGDNQGIFVIDVIDTNANPDKIFIKGLGTNSLPANCPFAQNNFKAEAPAGNYTPKVVMCAEVFGSGVSDGSLSAASGSVAKGVAATAFWAEAVTDEGITATTVASFYWAPTQSSATTLAQAYAAGANALVSLTANRDITFATHASGDFVVNGAGDFTTDISGTIDLHSSANDVSLTVSAAGGGTATLGSIATGATEYVQAKSTTAYMRLMSSAGGNHPGATLSGTAAYQSAWTLLGGGNPAITDVHINAETAGAVRLAVNEVAVVEVEADMVHLGQPLNLCGISSTTTAQTTFSFLCNGTVAAGQGLVLTNAAGIANLITPIAATEEIDAIAIGTHAGGTAGATAVHFMGTIALIDIGTAGAAAGVYVYHDTGNLGEFTVTVPTSGVVTRIGKLLSATAVTGTLFPVLLKSAFQIDLG